MEVLNKNIHQKIERPIRIMQFGEGNFLRAFIDWFIDEMNKKADFDTNVVVVQPLEMGRVMDLKAQDGLYTLILEGRQNGKDEEKHQVIDVFNDYINPYTMYNEYLEYAKSDDLKMIISNTTEAGIALNKEDTDLTKTPTSFPGKLLALLKARYDYTNGDLDKGYFIVACELIDNNGDELKRCLNELAVINDMSQEFIDWMNKANKFYNTLVDRIVPGYPRDKANELFERFGYIDNNMVKGEIFHLWVMDGDPAIKEFLPFEKTNLNILFVDSIKPYKERKVKILNGAHTCMVPVAYLQGIRTVGDVMKTPSVREFVSNFVEEEVLPTIKLEREEILNFRDSVFERFENPYVRHELMSISLNSMTKYKTRILPSASSYYEVTKQLPKHALFSFAALMNMYFLKKEDGTSLISDDACFLDMYRELEGKSAEEIVSHIMRLEHYEGAFEKMDGAIEFTTKCFDLIREQGVEVALKEVFNKYGK